MKSGETFRICWVNILANQNFITEAELQDTRVHQLTSQHCDKCLKQKTEKRKKAQWGRDTSYTKGHLEPERGKETQERAQSKDSRKWKVRENLLEHTLLENAIVLPNTLGTNFKIFQVF